jgi:hypothetical protein
LTKKWPQSQSNFVPKVHFQAKVEESLLNRRRRHCSIFFIFFPVHLFLSFFLFSPFEEAEQKGSESSFSYSNIFLFDRPWPLLASIGRRQ